MQKQTWKSFSLDPG